MIATIIAIIIEALLMLGLILCIAYCSGYISLTYTSLDKGKSMFYIYIKFTDDLLLDVIAALLASMITAVSIVFYNGLLYLLGKYIYYIVNIGCKFLLLFSF